MSDTEQTEEVTVEACPECDKTSGFRPHKPGGEIYANDPDEYVRTDYTCKASGCGAYLQEHEIVERPPRGHTANRGQATVGNILAREDVTTFEEARRVSQEREEA